MSKGDPELPRNQQGSRVQGVPIGQREFVRDFLEVKRREQARLFQRIPWVQDTGAAFLLLLMCGSTRANFWLRSVQPDLTEGFVEPHCPRTTLGTPSAPDEARSWPRWPCLVEDWGSRARGRRVEHGAPETPPLCGDHDSASGGGNWVLFPGGAGVQRVGGRGRPGSALWDRVVPLLGLRRNQNQTNHGKAGSRRRPQVLVRRCVAGSDDSRRAMLRSQHGLSVSVALTALPTSRATRSAPQLFRLLLCRRLHFPLPLSHRTCRCGLQLDVFGHHRAACLEAGVLGKRACLLECAAAPVCREAAARVSLSNMFVRHMDVAIFNALDGRRRLEIVADGLTTGKEPSWPSTRRWCLLSGGMGRPG